MCLFFNCIAVCATRKVEKKLMTVTMNEGYFHLFLKTIMGIFLNYGGAGSHHGGAGRITLHAVDFKSQNTKNIYFEKLYNAS